ncbi:MAG TPA: hypothetical protein VK395_16560 [Gemmataceae bacterium]|nr:hypothetical protein [Gemmataceae bacterium]
MKLHARTFMMVTLGLAAFVATKASAQKVEPATPDGVEVLARGPVHEAFATPSQARPLPSNVVPKKPPDPIEEVPPDQKPAGDHVLWIPGYWGWDDEQRDYLWVSGLWRVPPPDRQWIPGNWQQVEDGWQWTSGFWAAADQNAVTYLPAPPPSIDEGPSIPAPDENSIYIPGCNVSVWPQPQDYSLMFQGSTSSMRFARPLGLCSPSPPEVVAVTPSPEP